MASRIAQQELMAAFGRLDERLLQMVEAARTRSGREPGGDPFRGLYVSEADLYESLAVSSAESQACAQRNGSIAGVGLFAELAEIFSLTPLEQDVLLIALASDLDPRYARIFAYLQDDVSRKRPGIDLILSAISVSHAAKIQNHQLFFPAGSLLSNRLVVLSGGETASLSGREVRIEPRIAAYLLGDPGIDSSLSHWVGLVEPVADPTQPADAGLVTLIESSGIEAPLVIYFRGVDEESKRSAATRLARHFAMPLLIADLRKAPSLADSLEDSLTDLAREALLHSAITFIGGVDEVAPARNAVLRAAAQFPGVTILSGSREFQADTAGPSGVVTVPFNRPDWPERRRFWVGALESSGIEPQPAVLDTFAECFHFSSRQISSSVETGCNLASYRGEKPQASHVFEAARSVTGHELRNLTRRVIPAHSWDDIVLPAEPVSQLREICRRVRRRHQVLDKWGFENKLSSGKGICALFYGYSGTGKTMAAEVIAHALELDLYKIDLAGVVSKYIGETEKNLDRIFDAAESANGILFFDEADALFGKRSEVRDSHDRYANLEISYLLQKMEQYEGIAILATNLRQNLDDAFLRRLTFVVPFPFPDIVDRQRIWEKIWPQQTPLAADVDAVFLASRFLLSGGNIRNVALAAAYLAIEDRGPVALAHVLQAVRSEFQKMGKTLSPAELMPPALAQGAAA